MPGPSKTLPVPTPEQRRTAAEAFLNAKQWVLAGQLDKALPLLGRCCLLDPANIIYRQALGAARAQQLPARGPFVWLKKWLARGRLRSALRRQDAERVLRCADDLLTLAPDDVEAHLAVAAAFEMAGLLEHAVATLELAHSQFLNVQGAFTGMLARLYEQVGRFSLARALTRPRPELTAEDKTARLRELLGDPCAYFLQHVDESHMAGDLGAANDWLARRADLTPNPFELRQRYIQLDLDTFRQDAAIAEQKLIKNPNNAHLQVIHARLLHEIQAREIELCRHKAERFPANDDYQMELGTKLLQAGQFEAALDVFGRIPSDTALAWQSMVYAGYCYLNLRQWHKAKPLFERALPLLPPNAEATRQELLRLLTHNLPSPPPSPPTSDF